MYKNTHLLEAICFRSKVGVFTNTKSDLDYIA